MPLVSKELTVYGMTVVLAIYHTIMVHYHGNHFLNPIFLGSESGCHGDVLHACIPLTVPFIALASPWYNEGGLYLYIILYSIDATQPTFYRSESDKSLIMSDLQIDTDLFGTILIQV